MVEILKDRPLMFSEEDGFWVAVNDEGTGMYLTDGVFTLTEGETYTIVINGVEYTGEAVTANVTGIGEVIGIGNADALTGGVGNGEPYAAGFTQAGVDASTFILAWFDTDTVAETYTVSLYEGTEEEETHGANIVLYDRNGVAVTYEGIETVSFNTDTEGEIATYTLGLATDEVPVALDLSAGNQTVTPTDTDFMRTAVIQKPDTLLSENIKKGVNIAGVEGNLIGEGVSKEVELNFTDDTQIVEPDPETLLSEVVIKKPDTLLPENIAKDVEIAGVVGTMKAGGGEPVPPSDINFYDYDGTIVAAWTLDELAAATALPENPTHEGLTSQGWNWTLEDLKTTNRTMNVGQMYITDNGKTRLYISIAAEGRMTVPLCISRTGESGFTFIDWGDGSDSQSISGVGVFNRTHTYPSVGEYIIEISTSYGGVLGFGDGTSAKCVMGATDNNGRVYCSMLKKVELGKNVTEVGAYAFYNCYGLETITMPSGVTSIGNYAFYDCEGLADIIMPSELISIGSSAFYWCHSLKVVAFSNSVTSIGSMAFMACYMFRAVTIPDSVTSIGFQAFQACWCMASIIIPSGVTSIGSNAFTNCYGIAEYHLKPTTPPTLGTTAFSNIPSDCIIYVPQGCLSAYKSATNWSTYANYIREEP